MLKYLFAQLITSCVQLLDNNWNPLWALRRGLELRVFKQTNKQIRLFDTKSSYQCFSKCIAALQLTEESQTKPPSHALSHTQMSALSGGTRLKAVRHNLKRFNNPGDIVYLIFRCFRLIYKVDCETFIVLG